MTKFQYNLESNFIPIWSCIEDDDFGFNVKNSINIELNCLVELATPVEFSKLLHSLTQKGK